jgi:hypothetical protein
MAFYAKKDMVDLWLQLPGRTLNYSNIGNQTVSSISSSLGRRPLLSGRLSFVEVDSSGTFEMNEALD